MNPRLPKERSSRSSPDACELRAPPFAPTLPGWLGMPEERERFAAWCLAVLGARVEWCVDAQREPVGLVYAPPAIAAMVRGLAATYDRKLRIVRAEGVMVPPCD